MKNFYEKVWKAGQGFPLHVPIAVPAAWIYPLSQNYKSTRSHALYGSDDLSCCCFGASGKQESTVSRLFFVGGIKMKLKNTWYFQLIFFIYKFYKNYVFYI